LALLNGAPLSIAKAKATAERLEDSPIGFYMATHPDDALFFAGRRTFPDGATILLITMKPSAVSTLQGQGAQPIPQGDFPSAFKGLQLFIPPTAFPTFNGLRGTGAIRIAPYMGQ
jgi:hypothetical protein